MLHLSMTRLRYLTRLLVSSGFLLIISISTPGQQRERWQRVYTGEDSVIEIDVSSLGFEPGYMLRANFRTILSKAEGLDHKGTTKYKSRIETVLFKPHERRYRFEGISWIDSKGNRVHQFSATPSVEWKAWKQGGMMERMFEALRTLAPFGTWRIIDSRLASAPPNEAAGREKLTRLIGDRVILDLDQAQVGNRLCKSVAYESHRLITQEFSRKLGIEPTAIDIGSQYVDTVAVKCLGEGWTPPQSMLIEFSKNRLLMLWEGLFLVLDQRTPLRRFSSATLKRRLPSEALHKK